MVLPVLATILPMVLKGAMDSYSHFKAGANQRAMANEQAGLMEDQAAQVERQAAEAIHRGSLAASGIARQSFGLGSQQGAAYASQGVDLGVGVPQLLAEQTALLGQLDYSLTIRNARNQASGFMSEAAGIRRQADLTRKAGRQAHHMGNVGGMATALTHGIQAHQTYKKEFA